MKRTLCLALAVALASFPCYAGDPAGTQSWPNGLGPIPNLKGAGDQPFRYVGGYSTASTDGKDLWFGVSSVNSGTTYQVFVEAKSGNVGVGALPDGAAKLRVWGDLKVTGVVKQGIWNGSVIDPAYLPAASTLLSQIGNQRGDVLYYNGTDWVVLHGGTDGYAFTTHGTSSNPTWSPAGAVTSVTGSGAGVNVSPTTGNVVVSNTGVTTVVAGTNVTISGGTGAVTVNAPTMIGDSGSGGTAGAVPAPAAGDATKFLRGDGTFQMITIPPGNPFSDASALVKNGSDATKLAILSAAAIPHATTRTYVLPDIGGKTLATIDGGQTFTSASWTATPIAAAYLGAHASTHNAGGSDALAVDAAAGTGSLRTIGTGALQACAGNDSRLTDSRAPTGSAGGDLSGTYPSPTVARINGNDATSVTAHAFFGRSAGTTGAAAFSVLAAGDLPDVSSTYQVRSERGAASGYASLDGSSLVVQNPANATATPTASKIVVADGAGKVDGWVTSGAAAGTPSLRALGSTSTTACAGNDSRLSDSRAPNGSASGDLSGSYPGPSVVAINGASVTSVAAHAFYGRSSSSSGAGAFSTLATGDIPSLDFAKITTGIVPLAQGGTAVDNTGTAINNVFAGPSGGSSGNATFRALVAADVPSLDASKITTGTLAQARGGTGIDTSASTDGQILVGATSGHALALATITATANQTTVTNGTNSITVGTVQSIGTGSNVQFNRVGIGTSPAVSTAITTNQSSATLVSGTTNYWGGACIYTDGGTTSTNTIRGIYMNPTINYTAVSRTGHYEGIYLQVVETSVPTGTNYLLRLAAGSAGATDEFAVTNAGNVTVGTWQATVVTPTYGGSGVSNPTAHTIAINEGSSNQTNTGVGTNGQLVVGSTGADPVWATVSTGTGISTTLGAGTFQINNTGVTSAVATANQTTVSGATGAVTIGTVQDIATASSPRFASLGLGIAAVANQTVSSTESYTVTTTGVNDIKFATTWADGGTTSTATTRALYLNPTINMTAGSATGKYEALVVEAKETALGSGANVLMALRAGSAGTTNKFVVDNTGTVTTGVWNGTAVAATYVGNLPASQITSGQIALAQGGLAVDASSVTAHAFFGRSSASSGAPAFSVLAAGDVPDVSSTYQVRSERAAASGYASLDGSTLVVQNPASATATPGASKIVISDGSSTVNSWVTSLAASVISSGQLSLTRGGTALDSSGVTDGQLLVGQTSGHTFGLATISAGAGISVTNAGHSITIANTGTAAPFSDAATLVKNADDPTKLAILSAASISTGTTRTYTLPNVAGATLATIDGGQTFTSATWHATAVGSVYGGTGIDSSGNTDGQILVGATSGHAFALANITGTANRVTVTNGANTISLSGPQDLATSSNPQFATLGLGTAAVANQTLTCSCSYTVTTTSVNNWSNVPTWADGGTTSTATTRGLFVNPTINDTAASATGHYEAITVQAKETALPSGVNYLLRLSAGSAGTTDEFTVRNDGFVATKSLQCTGGLGAGYPAIQTSVGYSSPTTNSDDVSLQSSYSDGGTTSTAVIKMVRVNPTINYTASSKTGHYEALAMNVVETSLPTGTNYFIRCQAGSAGTTDKFTVTNSGTVTTGIWNGTALIPTYGGSGVSNPTAHTIPINEGSSNYANVTALTNGQLIVGSTGADPAAATLGTGTGISITTGAGTLTVNNTGVTSNVATANQVSVSGATGAVTLSCPSPFIPGTTTATFASTDNSGSDAAGRSLTLTSGAGTGLGVDGNVQITTAHPTATGSSVNAQDTRVSIDKVFVCSNTTATVNTIAQATLATTLTAATYWVFVNVYDTNGTDIDVASQAYRVNVVNKAGTLTVGTLNSFDTLGQSGTSGTVTVAPTVTASGTTISFKVTPAFATMTSPTIVRCSATIIACGPTVITPQ